MRRDSFLRGAFILAAGTLVSRALGALYVFLLPVLWGGGKEAVYGLGLFGYVLNIYIVVLTLSSLGIPLAVSRLVAERTARGDATGAQRVFAVARATLFFAGLTLTVAMIAAAPLLSRFYHPDVVPSILAVAPAVFFVSVMSAYRGLFQGLRVMTPYAVSQIVEQVVRVATILALGVLLLPFGIRYAAAGASFGAVAGAVVGLAYLIVVYERVAPLRQVDAGPGEEAGEHRSVRRILSELVALAIPLSLAGLAYPILGLVDNIVVPLRLQQAGVDRDTAVTAFGSLTQVASRLANVPTAFTTGIALSLMPAVAEAYALGQRVRVSRLTGAALRVTLLITIPMAAGLLALAREITTVIFRYPEAEATVQVLAPATVFLGIQQMSSAVLQGVGLQQLPVRNLFTGVLVKSLLTWVLTRPYGVGGAGLATVIGFLVSGGLNLFSVYSRLGGVSELAASVLRPTIAASVMYAAVRLLVGGLEGVLGLPLTTLLAVALGAAAYGLVLLLIGGVRAEDFDMIPRYGERVAALLKRWGLLRD